MQERDGGWKPVAYASKVNSETEGKYGITELECLAVVWAIKLFRPYLYGRKFTILTDHAALKWLMTSPNLTGKLHRWALTLQEFDFDVQYRPGSTNVVADALSRAPAAATELAAIGRRRLAKQRAAERVAPTEGTGETADAGGAKETTAQRSEGDQVARIGAELGMSGSFPEEARSNDRSAAAASALQPEPEKRRTGDTAQDTATSAAAEQRSTTGSELPVTRGAAETEAAAVTAAADGVVETDTALSKHKELPPRRTRRAERQTGAGTTLGPQTRAAKRLAEEAERRRRDEATALNYSESGSGGVPTTTSGEEHETYDAPASTLVMPVGTVEVRRAMSTEEQTTSAGSTPASDDELRGLPAARDATATTPTLTGGRRDTTTNRQRRVGDEATGRGRRQATPVAKQYANPQKGGEEQVQRKMPTRDTVGPQDKAQPRPTKAGKGRRPADTVPSRTGGDEGRETLQGHDATSPAGEAESLDARRPSEPTLQLTDQELVEAQQRSRLVQRLAEAGEYQGKKVLTAFELVLIETANGRRVVLPPALATLLVA
ncbi:hypothetical protein PR002_g29094 [Phytophthora rubi]|uniref:Reverse transcriptase RNase H-like domain-containing protein n=2 Tax=Phytophthora rubi TaxID=129364 RepID=A0A6A3H3B6_9STRA|nr:hypothetical protein PR002_g29094 [Phytophthora rubi]